MNTIILPIIVGRGKCYYTMNNLLTKFTVPLSNALDAVKGLILMDSFLIQRHVPHITLSKLPALLWATLPYNTPQQSNFSLRMARHLSFQYLVWL